MCLAPTIIPEIPLRCWLPRAFLENYLVFSTWILHGPSIECYEKKHQHFSLYVVFDLEAGRFKFIGENLLGAVTVKNDLSTLDSFS